MFTPERNERPPSKTKYERNIRPVTSLIRVHERPVSDYFVDVRGNQMIDRQFLRDHYLAMV